MNEMKKMIIFINRYLHMNTESVGRGQDFGIGSILVSFYSPSVVRVVLTKEVECFG